MTDDLERARPADREQAIAAVEAAYAVGRIVAHDRAFRIDQIRTAGLRGEVQALVRDLPAPLSVSERRPPPAPVRRRRAPGRVLAVVAIGAILVVAVVVTMTTSLVTGSSDVVTSTETTSERQGVVDLLSRPGYAALVEAVEQRTGRREAFQLVLYPERATVDLPVDRRSRRQMSYTWDGTWNVFGGKGTSMGDRFSLDDVNGGLLRRLVTKARGQVEEPTTWYAVVRAPTPGLGGSVMAFATNDFGESSSVQVDLDPKRRAP